MARFPSNVVARNGYAGVLKAQGRYDEALEAYREAMARFPDDGVARTGYAEVLKAQGRYDEAVEVYRETMARFPDDVVAHSGYPEVLKVQGRYDEAAEAYRQTMARFPNDAFAANGYAHVLVLLGKHQEALAVLRDEEPRSTHGWIGLHIRGMIYLRQGTLDEAVAIFERGAREAPPEHRVYFRSALAVAELRRRRFPAVIEVLEPHLGAMPASERSTASMLLAHAFGEQAEVTRAEEHLARTQDSGVGMIVELRRALAERYQLRLDGRMVTRSRPVEALDVSVAEQEFRLLSIAA
jgi:tetratricopeptide (TPR) repeat protein